MGSSRTLRTSSQRVTKGGLAELSGLSNLELHRLSSHPQSFTEGTPREARQRCKDADKALQCWHGRRLQCIYEINPFTQPCRHEVLSRPSHIQLADWKWICFSRDVLHQARPQLEGNVWCLTEFRFLNVCSHLHRRVLMLAEAPDMLHSRGGTCPAVLLRGFLFAGLALW